MALPRGPRPVNPSSTPTLSSLLQPSVCSSPVYRRGGASSELGARVQGQAANALQAPVSWCQMGLGEDLEKLLSKSPNHLLTALDNSHLGSTESMYSQQQPPMGPGAWDSWPGGPLASPLPFRGKVPFQLLFQVLGCFLRAVSLR